MRWLYLIILFLLFISRVSGQIQRYELGKRMKLLEIELEKNNNPDSRKAALDQINKAVQNFFSLQLDKAAANLDRARLILEGRDQDPRSSWAESLFVDSDARLYHSEVRLLKVKLDEFYKVERSFSDKISWRLSISDTRGKNSKVVYTTNVQSLPLSCSIDIGNLKEGDYLLKSEIIINRKIISTKTILLSFIKSLGEKLARWEKLINESKESSWRRETMREYLRILKNLSQNKVLEMDIPAFEFLARMERLNSFLPRQGLLVIPYTPAEAQVSRIFVPEDYSDRKAYPLVIALHGAGGSENLFFEGYGNGKIVKLCKDRGWILIAPRSFGFSAEKMQNFIDEVAKIYNIDRKNVFIIGHSLGAIQALNIVAEKPALFGAIALISVGRLQKFSEQMRKLPIFIAAGSADFSLQSSKSLYEFLKQSEVKNLQFKVYENVEHLTAVQFSLDDAFKFFDLSLK